MPTLIELPAGTDICKLADWMELNCILDPDANTSREDLLSLLSNGADPEPDQIDASESDTTVQSVLNELKRRSVAAGDGYPFDLEEDLLSVKDNFLENYLAYVYCLILSFLGVDDTQFSTRSLQKKAKDFEDLCRHSTIALLGTDLSPVKVYTFGFPRDDSDFDSTKFIEALEQICKESGEMRPINLAAAKAQSRKDAGLDIIAWKQFPDTLPGGILFWGQCATGKRWDAKLHDIRNFKGYVEVYAGRITGVFIPHIVETSSTADRQIWNINTEAAGRIFDRCRIALLARDWHNTEASNYCQAVITKIQQQGESEQ